MPVRPGEAFEIAELRIGRVAPLGPAGVPSAIDKQQVAGPVMAGPLGLDGDEQGDRKHHGGPHKALHAYALAHLLPWAAELPHRALHGIVRQCCEADGDRQHGEEASEGTEPTDIVVDAEQRKDWAARDDRQLHEIE